MRPVRVRRTVTAALIGLGAFGAGTAGAAVEFDRLVDSPTKDAAEHTAWVDPSGQRIWTRPKGFAYLSIFAARVPRRATTRLELENGAKVGGPVLEDRSAYQLNAPKDEYAGRFYVSYVNGAGARVRERVGRLRVRDAKPQPGVRHPRQPLDVMVVVDASSSMRTVDPLRRRRDALDMLFALSKRGDRVGVVKFGSGSQRVLPLTPIRNARQARKLSTRAGKRLTASGGTNYDAAFNLANDTIVRAGNLKRRKVIVLLSDGDHDTPGGLYQNSHLRLAQNPTGRAWPVCAVRLGSAFSTRGANRMNRIAVDTLGYNGQVDSAKRLVDTLVECRVREACEHTVGARVWDLARGKREAGGVVLPLGRRRAIFRVTGRRRHQVRLVGPSGRGYGPGSLVRGMRYSTGRNWAMYQVDGPRAGKWAIAVKATGLKAGATDSVTVRATVDRCGKRSKLVFPAG